MKNSVMIGIVLLAAFTTTLQAQDIIVYDDSLQNGFQNYSYGGGSDFNNMAPVHGGTKSISFTGGEGYNAISFARPAPDLNTAQYATIRFWIHGGAAGGQQLTFSLEHDDGAVPVASAELDSYITGGAIVANAWREVVVTIGQGALAYAGPYDRFNLQSDNGGQPQPPLYVDDVTIVYSQPQATNLMLIEQAVEVAGMVSDRFTWRDSANRPRVAVLAHNNTDPEPNNGGRGGALREFRYQLPSGATRILNVTTYGNGGYLGFGYIVSHASRSGCVGGDSPLGGRIGGNFQRVFEGRHHAIFRFTQNYPRNCATTNPVVQRDLPVTIDWVFSTGRDNPLWAVTYDIEAAAAANTFFDDSRAPYGELNIDGTGAATIDGTAWGDRYKFTTTSSPISVNSSWTWNQPNTVPWVKEWINGPVAAGNTRDATIGVVQTQTMTQQDAGGGRDPDVGSDIRPFWNKTSANGNACGAKVMPCGDDWPYQANGNSVEFGPNNARMAWKTQYGFIGQTTYNVNDGVVNTAPGFPKKSYSTYIVLGTHTGLPVEAQVTQIETIQTLTLTAATGSVVASGPAGIARNDNVTYAPPGYNHVYGALSFNAAGNQLDANVAVGNGTLKKPLFIIRSFTAASYPTVKFAGITLTPDVDYFASLRAASNELWLTLNRDLTGATNRLEIVSAAATPAIPTGVVATVNGSTQVTVSWTAVAGATHYQIDRKLPGGQFIQVGSTQATNYSDNQAQANTAHLYQVRAVNGVGPSANSAPDLATTVIFTDPALNPGMIVKATHLAQLRTAVDAVRSLAATGGGGYTDAAVAGTTIKAVHLTELRNAINTARTALGLTNAAYTDPTLANVKVKAVHVVELRSRVQ